MWGRGIRKILILPTSRPTLGLRPAFLQQNDIRVVEAPRVDAVTLARRERFRLIIQDLPTPVDVGLEVSRALKADPQARSTPLIVVAQPGAEQEVLASGADAVVHAPIVQRQYFETISRFVRLPKRRTLRHAINLRFLYEIDGRSAQAFTRDLSTYGAFIKTDHTLAPGTCMAVRFQLPGETEPIRCSAIVRRTLQAAGFGVEFLEMSEVDQRRLEKLVRRHLGKSFLSRVIDG